MQKLRSQPHMFSQYAPETDFTIINKTGAMTIHNPTAKKMKISTDTHQKISKNIKCSMDFGCDFEYSKYSAFSHSSNTIGCNNSFAGNIN